MNGLQAGSYLYHKIIADSAFYCTYSQNYLPVIMIELLFSVWLVHGNRVHLTDASSSARNLKDKYIESMTWLAVRSSFIGGRSTLKMA